MSSYRPWNTNRKTMAVGKPLCCFHQRRRNKISTFVPSTKHGQITSESGPKVIDILLVEDNAGDALLVQKAFELGRIANRIFTVTDGEEALAFLRGEGKYAGVPRPDLIILDLNMPVLDGREALAMIKADPALLSIPIIVMTTSDDERDIVNSYKLHVNCYITKPVQVREFLEVIKAIDYFWIGVVTLPSSV